MRKTPALLALLVVGLVVLFAAGCAKKAAEAPPTPPPAPPVTQPTTPAPTPTTPPETQTPAPTPQVTSGDFTDAFFDLDSYALRDDAKAALDRAAKLLRDNTGVSITLEGHCDERGTVEYNLALGNRRAAATADYLVDLGVLDRSRAKKVSFGKERPLNPGHDEAAWAQNRRAEFKLACESK
jgi:peptidoglycan-associated lipoprotein